LWVSGSMSTKATRAPVMVTASEVAMKLLAGTATSSSGPTPRALRARYRASVPFPTPMQCFTPQNEANLSSKDLTYLPPTKAVSEMTLEMASSICGLMAWYCLFRSTSGICILFSCQVRSRAGGGIGLFRLSGLFRLFRLFRLWPIAGGFGLRGMLAPSLGRPHLRHPVIACVAGITISAGAGRGCRSRSPGP